MDILFSILFLIQPHLRSPEVQRCRALRGSQTAKVQKAGQSEREREPQNVPRLCVAQCAERSSVVRSNSSAETRGL